MKKSLMILGVLMLLSSTVWSESIEWNAPTPGEVIAGHILYWVTPEGVEHNADIPGADITSYALPSENYNQGQVYCFQLTAYNEAGESEKTSPLCEPLAVKIPKIPAGLNLVSD